MDPGPAVPDPGLETLRQHRAELRESMSALEQALAAPAPGRVAPWAERVEVALVELAGDIRTHLQTTEGDDGLHGAVLVAAPRLRHEVDRLVRDHDAMTTTVDELCRSVRSLADHEGVDAVRDRATALLALLSRHRQRGADLVHEAYEVDVGGET